MARYFLEVAYNGTHYSGFQIQENANSIQGEIEKALAILFRQSFALTGSSRTDAGVHALQNFFHLDTELAIPTSSIYRLNAILPKDIVIKKIHSVLPNAHCRFDATHRAYQYSLHQFKNPFRNNDSWFYPYEIDLPLLQEAAQLVLLNNDFTSFSKRNTQVNNFICTIYKSEWEVQPDCLVYHVTGNRFLRGMVRGLVGTMLRVGRKQITLARFQQIIDAKDCTQADFTTPAKGLFLVQVHYPASIFVPLGG